MSVSLCLPEEGELVLVRLRIQSSQLEEVLECLASLPFPVNPDLQHDGLESIVEFPAYESRFRAVNECLASFEVPIEKVPMADAMQLN